MNKLISVDFYADFGFLKKPDTNNPMYFSFNMLHKPALLGILGAIIGEKGFYDDDKLLKSQGKGKNATSAYERGNKPDYYAKLEHLKIGIQPLRSNKGIFIKDTVQYNNGTGLASEEIGGNLIVKEQFIIEPGYRCYLSLDTTKETDSKLYDYLKNSWAEYLPYFGKNDFSLWWETFQEYDAQPIDFELNKGFVISTIFIKETPVKEGKQRMPRLSVYGKLDNEKFMYFENLPIDYDTDLWQYRYEAFAFTNFSMKADYEVNDLFNVKSLVSDEKHVIQLF
ncbi:MAG: type I-B CRISPR-associated protein Cas5b [Saprospiraceae bacterium]|nr:type I-B CRISPR-associated protein Cas5b [Saprospiraceae bacterium]